MVRMEKEMKQAKELVKKIDNTELLSDEDLDKMDFYQLSYYLQTLNQIDSLVKKKELKKGDGKNE